MFAAEGEALVVGVGGVVAVVVCGGGCDEDVSVGAGKDLDFIGDGRGGNAVVVVVVDVVL
jgi:hypothetical protein